MTTTPKQEAHTATPWPCPFCGKFPRIIDCAGLTPSAVICPTNLCPTSFVLVSIGQWNTHAGTAALVAALEEMIATCEGLADQQAMEDNWYIPKLEAARRALELARTPTPGGKP